MVASCCIKIIDIILLITEKARLVFALAEYKRQKRARINHKKCCSFFDLIALNNAYNYKKIMFFPLNEQVLKTN